MSSQQNEKDSCVDNLASFIHFLNQAASQKRQIKNGYKLATEQRVFRVTSYTLTQNVTEAQSSFRIRFYH